MNSTTLAGGLRRKNRRTICVIALLLAVFTPAALAHAHASTETYTGSIRLAHGAFNAVTAWGAPCDPKSPLNGADGVWFKVPSGTTQVSMSPAGTLDADVLFYTGSDMFLGRGCESTYGGLFGKGYGRTVSGPVPSDASFLIVNGWLGTGTFTIEFSQRDVR